MQPFAARGVLLVVMAVITCHLTVQGQPRQVAQVSGVVTDLYTGEPLPGATVLFGNGGGSLTDGKGRFRMDSEVGNLTLTIQFLGYRKEVREIHLLPGDSMVLVIRMTPQVTEINQVVISAGKAEQRLSDLTVSMSVIRPEAIDGRHIQDAQELLNKTSGIEILDGQASIRGGSGFSYGAGSRVMVLIDGLPMLSGDAGHVRWQSLPFENLSQVEVIKGASSVLYGSSALNGIISFRTAEADTNGVTKFFAESGVFGNPPREAWRWWSTPRHFSSASLTHLKRYGNTEVHAGGFLMIDNGYRDRNENNYGRINLRLKHHNQKVKGLTYGIAMNGLVSRKQDFVLWENGTTGALMQDSTTAQQLHGTSLTIDPTIRLKRGSRFTHDLRSRFQFTRNDFPENGQNNSEAISLYNEYQFRYMLTKAIALNSGLMHYNSTIRSPFYGDHSGTNSAIYSQADLSLSRRIKLVAGMRVEQNTLDNVRAPLVPLFRAGANYRLATLTFLRASYGQGYRHPSIAEKFASTTLGAVKIIPSPGIRAEAGWNAEIGVKQGVKSKRLDGLIDFALFYTQNRDMIEYVFGLYSGDGMGFRATNIEHSRVYGFEVEYLLHTNPGRFRLTFSGGYVYMYPVEFNPHTGKNTDVMLKFRRNHSFSFNAIATVHKFDLSVQTYVRSRILNIDDVFLNPLTREDILPGFYDYWLEHNDGHFLMDLSIGYELWAKYKLSIALKNLTNTEYMGRPGDIQPHRNVSIRISGKL
jgi:outer membrane receptor protein involved in Fe transport